MKDNEIIPFDDAIEVQVEEIPADQEPFVVELPTGWNGVITVMNNSNRVLVIRPPQGVKLHLEE